MVKIVVGAHGRFADGVKSAIEVVCGKQENVFWLNAYTEDGVWDVQGYLDRFYKDVSEQDQVILLTDLYSGSVNKEFAKYTAGRRDSILVSGFNLALAIEIISNSERILSADEIREMIEICRGMMQIVQTDSAQEDCTQEQGDFWSGGESI